MWTWRLVIGMLIAQTSLYSQNSSKVAWRQQLQRCTEVSYWQQLDQAPKLSRENLSIAIEAARVYYLNQQLLTGNFTYAFDISDGASIDDDNQVRQAGALWGLACLNRARFTEASRRALLLGLDFFARQQRKLPDGLQPVCYPEQDRLKTGTVALYCLALTEFLIGQEKLLPLEVKNRYLELLRQQLLYLRSMELSDGSWAMECDVPTGYRDPIASPYYDGETLLAYCKMARYLGMSELLPRIREAVPKLIKKYTVDAWAPAGTEASKGFYQWGCLSFAEYVEAGWAEADCPAEAALALSWWQLYDNKLEARGGNTAYAVEGLLATWRIAKQRGDTASQVILRTASENILGRLMLCQVGGPFKEQNLFLQHLPQISSRAFGGITASLDSSIIRIDIVQHQLHAMLLVLQYLYNE